MDELRPAADKLSDSRSTSPALSGCPSNSLAVPAARLAPKNEGVVASRSALQTSSASASIWWTPRAARLVRKVARARPNDTASSAERASSSPASAAAPYRWAFSSSPRRMYTEAAASANSGSDSICSSRQSLSQSRRSSSWPRRAKSSTEARATRPAREKSEHSRAQRKASPGLPPLCTYQAAERDRHSRARSGSVRSSSERRSSANRRWYLYERR